VKAASPQEWRKRRSDQARAKSCKEKKEIGSLDRLLKKDQASTRCATTKTGED